MKTAEKKIVAVRSGLVLDEPFWGHLILKLRMVADPSCETAWVDGITLGYNPAYIESLTHDETKGVMVHEVGHCALGHPWRRGGRDHDKWNVACDHALNPMIVDAGYRLPDGVLLDEGNRGKSAEWVYDRLPGPQPQDEADEGEAGNGTDEDEGTEPQGQGGDADDPQDDGTGDGEGSPQDGDGAAGTQAGKHPHGEVRDAPTDAQAIDDGGTEADWKQSVQEAARIAEARGSLPGGMERFAQESARPVVDWKSVLRRFVQDASRSDYTWRQPNRRYMAQGLYLPSLHADGLGAMVVAVDTSGSIDEVLLSQFTAEINAIAEDMQPSRVHVMYCDSRVHRTDTYEQGEPIESHPVGGGGTDFRPVFAAIETLDEPPVCVVYLTDLWGTFPDTEPEVPTLWACTSREVAPWGETVEVE